MKEIYLDNSATTPLCESALEGMKTALEHYGNPSSLHKMGVRAKALKEEATSQIYSALGIRALPEPSHKLIFTSCGTESNNLALWGVLNAKNFRFLPRIITTDSEHPSVLSVLEKMESEGRAEVVRLGTRGGRIDKEELLQAINERTVLVSIMLVNNETGAVYNVKELFGAAKAKKKDVITHCDMTQGFLKMKIPGGYGSLGADLMTLSGHKIHAPKGIALLAVSRELIKSKRIVSLMQGGGQEMGYRSGTENMAGICALGGACREGAQSLEERIERAKELSELFISSLSREIRVNTPEKRLPHIISITLPGIKSQTALSYLSSKGIYLSSGSACSSHGGHKSYVLLSFGLSAPEADCTLRVSLSSFNTREELVEAAREINNATENLVRI